MDARAEILRMRLWRARARAWRALRAGTRTTTPVIAGSRAGGREGAVPTTVLHRRSRTPDTVKVSAGRLWTGLFRYAAALKT
jgi:hypothetical protein